MNNYDKNGISLHMQVLLDSLFIELYEDGERKTVNQVSKELDVHSRTVYRYINYCAGMMKKAAIFRCMMCTLKFSANSQYYEAQQSYLERLQNLERKKRALLMTKRFIENQKEWEEKTVVLENNEKINKLK